MNVVAVGVVILLTLMGSMAMNNCTDSEGMTCAISVTDLEI